MLNKEKYAKELVELCIQSEGLALVHGRPVSCESTQCADCKMCWDTDCEAKRVEWANSEYKKPEVDWSKVPVDTPVLVRVDENAAWEHRHFAYFRNGECFVFLGGCTSWTATGAPAAWPCIELAEEENLG